MREEFMSFEGNTALFSLDFSSTEPDIDFVRLKLNDLPRARWHGLGPRISHAVHGRIDLDHHEETSAFSLDGRFLSCSSSGARRIGFAEHKIILDLELPARVHLGYAHDLQEAFALWHRWNGSKLDITPISNEFEWHYAHTNAAGLLGSLSFSGASPNAFHRLNRAIARNITQSNGWKVADLFLCQPDITLPVEFRRNLPPGLIPANNAVREQNRYSKIRAGLSQYWKFCEQRWIERGIPALAHPSILYPDECVFIDREDILCSGPDLLCSPNLRTTGKVAELVLPHGQWVHLWTSRIYHEGRVSIFAPHGNPALFYRAESDYAWLFDSIRQIASRL